METLSGIIVVADDDPDIRDILKDTLSSLGARAITVTNGQECLDSIEMNAPEVVLLDIEMPMKNGLDVLNELRQRRFDTTAIMITAYGTIDRAVPAMKEWLDVLKELLQRRFDTTAIMITAYGTIDRAVQAMKQGAFDFITKPFDLDHIAVIVKKALEQQRLKQGLQRFTQEVSDRYRLIGGKNPKMRNAIDT